MTESAGRWARRAWVAAALSLCVGVATARGAGNEPGDGGGVVTTTPVNDQADGMVPRRLVWPGVVVIVVIAVIVTAALTGSMIRANTDDEDESSPPASSD